MSSARGPTTISLTSDPNDVPTDSVIELADQNKATLGLMPAGAIRAIVARGDVLAAIDESGDFAGYAMFSVAHGRVRLIHVCVARTHRGRGIAQLLVRRLAADHAHLAGIVLKCRRDYAEATHLWKSLDFTPRAEVPGRGRDRTTLIVWWLSNDIPDLFTLTDEPFTTPVAIDHNVFIDLTVQRDREGAEESQSLEADWLREQISLKVTKESYREAADNTDPLRRKQQMAALTGFESLNYAPKAHEKAKADWEHTVRDIPGGDRSDCNHIISTAAAGVKLFITRDNRLIRKYARPAADIFGIRILHPLDLIVHLDELADATRYHPAGLRGTGFQVAVRGSGDEAELDTLLNNAGGERKTAFRALLRRVGADSDASRWWVRDRSGDTVAAFATRLRADRSELEVALLRSVPSTVGTTVGKLIAFQLRQNAVTQRLNRITVSDPYLPAHIRADLLTEGYRLIDGQLAAAVLDVRSRIAALETLNGHAALDLQVRDAIRDATTPDRIVTLERTLWPAKLLDSALPSYLVPIKPAWAEELFALRDTLWSDPGLLRLSREHVYYRTPGGSPAAPARIAWYVSGTRKPEGVGAVAAVSHLIQVDIAAPEQLFNRYQRLGVYNQRHVLAAARRGVAAALRFVDTENFPKLVPYEQLWTLPNAPRETTLQSPLEISSKFFGAIYNEGTQRFPRQLPH